MAKSVRSRPELIYFDSISFPDFGWRRQAELNGCIVF